MPKPLEFQNFPDVLASLAPYGPYRGYVREVLDGDTYGVLVSLGWDEYRYARIRLRDVDTPEVFHPTQPGELERGLLAKKRAEYLLLKKPVVLDTRPDAITYGRYVATVQYASRDGKTVRSFADTLRAEGLLK